MLMSTSTVRNKGMLSVKGDPPPTPPPSPWEQLLPGQPGDRLPAPRDGLKGGREEIPAGAAAALLC